MTSRTKYISTRKKYRISTINMKTMQNRTGFVTRIKSVNNDNNGSIQEAD